MSVLRIPAPVREIGELAGVSIGETETLEVVYRLMLAACTAGFTAFEVDNVEARRHLDLPRACGEPQT